MIIAIAPGGPGSRPTWTSSAKDMVTTALGTSRVWVTLGYGILNEVYWPATGLPQIRDLGFIVAGPSGWFEVKRVNRYQVSMPNDWVPLPQVAHEGDGYRLLRVHLIFTSGGPPGAGRPKWRPRPSRSYLLPASFRSNRARSSLGLDRSSTLTPINLSGQDV